jgi:hypothetical protein
MGLRFRLAQFTLWPLPKRLLLRWMAKVWSASISSEVAVVGELNREAAT